MTRMITSERALNRRRALALLGSLITAPATATVARAARFRTVVLDPGHGGSDNGAYWGGVREKHLNLDLAKRVQGLLRQKGVSSVLTRTSDVYLPLDTRVKFANRYSDSIFVSIHFNACTNRSITGIESFYYSTRGRYLASNLQSSLARRIRTSNRGIKRRPLHVLRNTRGTASLVECGFLSNAWERERCNSSWFRQVLAEAIAQGIVNYR